MRFAKHIHFHFNSLTNKQFTVRELSIPRQWYGVRFLKDTKEYATESNSLLHVPLRHNPPIHSKWMKQVLRQHLHTIK